MSGRFFASDPLYPTDPIYALLNQWPTDPLCEATSSPITGTLSIAAR